jgi:peptidoglycan-N-acetylglucosamine deacetylase
MDVTNFLTFDIEEWYHANYPGINFEDYSSESSRLEYNVDRLIALCEPFSIKTTCFILGDVAAQKPQIVTKLFDAGHEIASHGNSHQLVYPMKPEEFRKDIQIASDRLEQIIGQKVIGFRAPSWSVNQESLSWFYDILAQEGFIYSSSIYPGKNTHFGIDGSNEKVHYSTNSALIEIPQTVMNIFGNRLGYAGGGYLRFFPAWLIRYMIHKKNREDKNVFLYLHPREIDTDEQQLKLGIIDHYFHYQGIERTEEKLTSLLNTFQSTFSRMDDYVEKIRRKEIIL